MVEPPSASGVLPLCALRYFVLLGTSDLLRTWRRWAGWKRDAGDEEVEGVGKGRDDDASDRREKDDSSPADRGKREDIVWVVDSRDEALTLSEVKFRSRGFSASGA